MYRREFIILLLINATVLIPVVAGDFGHNIENPVGNVDYSAQASNSCWKKEIDSLKTAATDSIQSSQDLDMGKAAAYDRLAELGQTC